MSLSLSDAADELYSTDPATFVERRTELVKQARTSGDKALAKQIEALRRPTVSAWYLNLLARSGTSELDDLLDLGARMRDAQSRFDMATVTSLAPERQKRETAVLRRLDLLLAPQGITPSAAVWSEVGRTLTAVVADASAADAVRSGCLARGLGYAGFGEVDLSGALGAELEALVDRRAADRAGAGEADATEAAPEAKTTVAATSGSDAESLAGEDGADLARQKLLEDARARYAQAVEERRDAEREVAELGVAYAAAQERLRSAELAEAAAESALEAAGEDH